MSIHTENLARRIGAQLLLAMAEQSLTFDDVAKNLSAPDDTGSGRVPAAQVRNLILDLAQGKDASMAVVAQLAWGVNRVISPHLAPRDGGYETVFATTAPETAAVNPQISGKLLTVEDLARVIVVTTDGSIGLLTRWFQRAGRNMADIMVGNSVERTVFLDVLRFASRLEVETDETMRGVGHTPVYAGEAKS